MSPASKGFCARAIAAAVRTITEPWERELRHDSVFQCVLELRVRRPMERIVFAMPLSVDSGARSVASAGRERVASSGNQARAYVAARFTAMSPSDNKRIRAGTP